MIPKADPSIGVTLSYGVGLNALYFRVFCHLGDTVVVVAKGERRGVLGIIDTYRLHSLFECCLSDGAETSAPSLVPTIFRRAFDQGVRFSYSALTLNPSLGHFFWTQEGWGTLLQCTKDRSLEIISNGTYTPSDRFFLAGCASPTLLEFASTPVVPLNIMLKEEVFSSRRLPPQKQTDHLLQKLRLRGDCVVGDYPACLISIQPSNSR